MHMFSFHRKCKEEQELSERRISRLEFELHSAEQSRDDLRKGRELFRASVELNSANERAHLYRNLYELRSKK